MVLVPVPEVDIPPGVRVKVHVPIAGRPFKTTLPADKVQVGWLIVPTVGAFVVAGWLLITTLAEADEIHPEALVTV